MSENASPPLSSQNKAEHQFLASEDCTFTYGDLQQFEDYLANFLHDYTPSLSQPLGIWAISCDLTIFAIAACWELNIPFVCLNPKARPNVLKSQIEAIHPALIITSVASGNITSDLKKSVKITELNLSEILKGHHPKKKPLQEHTPSHNTDVIFGYFFTSGTTAQPKIVPLKRRQMQAAASASAKNIKPKPNHYWLLCMPLHHVGGVSLILRSLIYGSAIYRIEPFDIDTVSNFLEKDLLFSVASLVPTMLKRLLDDPSFKTHAHFRAILLGGGPISPSLLKTCIQRTIPVIASYGMTETCAQIAANPINPKRKSHNLKSVGEIFDPNEIEIRDETETKLEISHSGSIWLKGPQIFDGYLNSPDAKSSFDENGWFNTGDFGRLDENNLLYLEARRTDVIISGGENISPFEIEAALEELSGIKEAAAFGIADKEWGQKVVAAIVYGTEEHLAPDKLQKYLKTKLEAFKIPKQFVFVDTLPRTQNGKIHRSKLADLL